MGTAAKKKRPMRSIRSGIKKLELVKANLAVLKKLVVVFVIILFASCTTPIRIIETTTTDSTGKTVRTIQKIYKPNHSYVPQASFNIISSPLFYPYNRPVIIPRYVPPVYRFTPLPTPRGGRRK